MVSIEISGFNVHHAKKVVLEKNSSGATCWMSIIVVDEAGDEHEIVTIFDHVEIEEVRDRRDKR